MDWNFVPFLGLVVLLVIGLLTIAVGFSKQDW